MGSELVLTRRALLGGAAGLAIAGCAKFPAAGTGNQVARVRFKLSVDGTVNTPLTGGSGGGYVYAVAIRASTDPNPDRSKDPVPILAANPNGIVAGAPTHMVVLAAPGTSVTQPYQLQRFRRLPPVGATPEQDLASDIDLNALPSTRVSPILNVTYTPFGTNPRTLEFELLLTDFTDGNLALAQALRSLQINFLTRTSLFTPGTGGSPYDSIGDNRNVAGLNSGVLLNLNGNAEVRLSPLDAPDELDDLRGFPDINIVDWSARVIQP